MAFKPNDILLNIRPKHFPFSNYLYCLTNKAPVETIFNAFSNEFVSHRDNSPDNEWIHYLISHKRGRLKLFLMKKKMYLFNALPAHNALNNEYV